MMTTFEKRDACGLASVPRRRVANARTQPGRKSISSLCLLALSAVAPLILPKDCEAAPRGSEFDLSLTPAAGGMEGVGVVRPQDPVAMLFGNPSTLTQLEGKYAFTLGASFVSPDLRARNAGPFFSPFAAPNGEERRSTEDKLALPHAAAIQKITDDLVAGFGFTGISGLGSDFRGQPGFPNIDADLALFGANLVAAYRVMPQLSVGATVTLGIGSLQAGTVENTAAVHDFGVGGTVGATYDFGLVKLGLDYKSPLQIKYEKAVESAPGTFSDITLEQPQEVAFGIASTDLFWKDTFVEIDYRFKNWDAAEGYNAVWQDQHIFSLAGQHSLDTRIGKLSLRAGWSYLSKLAKEAQDLGNKNNFGGVTSFANPNPALAPIPVTPAFLQLAQATITDGYWRQSVSGGVSLQITPNLRADLNANYGFDGSTHIGPFNVVGNIFGAGMGFTWTFN